MSRIPDVNEPTGTTLTVDEQMNALQLKVSIISSQTNRILSYLNPPVPVLERE